MSNHHKVDHEAGIIVDETLYAWSTYVTRAMIDQPGGVIMIDDYQSLSDPLKTMLAVLKLYGPDHGLTAEEAALKYWYEKPPSDFEGRKGAGLMLSASRLLARLVEHGYARREVTPERITFYPIDKDQEGQAEAGRAYLEAKKKLSG